VSTDAEHLLPERPPRQRAPQKRALDKIDAVVEATVKVLESEGETAVRIADIGAETGVSYGTIYHHFGDRDGLIRAAQFARLRSQPGQDLDAFGAALDGLGDPGDFVAAVMAISRSIADPSRRDIRMMRTSVLAAAQSRPELLAAVQELETKILDDLADLVARAQAAGIADPALDPHAAAMYLEAIAYGIVLGEYCDRQVDTEALAQVIFRGFTALLARS
jgi:AcrR family transcriptional regulator